MSGLGFGVSRLLKWIKKNRIKIEKIELIFEVQYVKYCISTLVMRESQKIILR